jgi:hypothetical protein
LGVTPSAWRSAFNVTYGERAFELTYSALVTQAGPSTILANNVYFNSSNQWIYKNAVANTNAGLYTIGSNGVHSWSVAPTGASGAVATFTQAMTLDASGNLGVGTTNPQQRLHIQDATQIRGLVSSGSNAIQFWKDSTPTFAASIGCGVVSSGLVSALVFETYLNGGSWTERMRISSDGNVGVGTTTTSNGRINVTQPVSTNVQYFVNSNAITSYGIQIAYTGQVPNNVGNEFIYCGDSGPRFVVRSNGGLANYSANNVNLSDRREKTNFAPATSYLDKICAIPVQTFNYIDQNLEEDGGLTLGVVAQDVQAVAPELVMESNWANRDDKPKMRLSIYQTDLQYALMKCIQEQQALITTLTERITALEGV